MESAQKLLDKREKAIERLELVRRQANHYLDEYNKAKHRGDKSTAQWARQNQIRYEKREFTAKAMIDKLNDKLNLKRGDYS